MTSKLSSLKQQAVDISEFLWVRNYGSDLAGVRTGFRLILLGGCCKGVGQGASRLLACLRLVSASKLTLVGGRLHQVMVLAPPPGVRDSRERPQHLQWACLSGRVWLSEGESQWTAGHHVFWPHAWRVSVSMHVKIWAPIHWYLPMKVF